MRGSRWLVDRVRITSWSTVARCAGVARRLTRGLNRNHNRVLKNVFKSAATAATARPGALQAFYHVMLARGMREDLARVTLTRKLAALTLRLWKTGAHYRSSQADDASAVAPESSRPGDGSFPSLTTSGFRTRVREAVPCCPFARLAVRRGTRLTMGPPAGPE